jgi:hypothetical protein
MRSAIAIASIWSWVTSSAESASETMSWRSHARASSRSLASRLDSGSSSRMTAGSETSARERDALLLPARQLVRIALGELGEADLRQRFPHPSLELGRADAAQLEAIGHVGENGAVRPQRVRLEHEAEPARLGRQVELASGLEQHLAADADRTAVRPLEAGDGAQQRGLAAARGAEQGDDLSRRHRDRHAPEDVALVVAQRQVIDDEIGHGAAR